MGFIIAAIALAIVALFLVTSVIKIVPQGREYTVERFGRYMRTIKPGMTILTPFVEAIGRRVNMMEQVLAVAQQEVITKDNVTVQVDAIVFIQVMDAATAVYRVDNLTYAIGQLAHDQPAHRGRVDGAGRRPVPARNRSTPACWRRSTRPPARGASRRPGSRSRTCSRRPTSPTP